MPESRSASSTSAPSPVEARRPLGGSFFSENVEDPYCSPYELGYGRMISFNHDFIGRDALEKTKDSVRRSKVTLVFDPEDVRKVSVVWGEHPGPGKPPRRGPRVSARPGHGAARALRRARADAVPAQPLRRHPRTTIRTM
ncbi:hypothetical protein ACWGDT_28320 [Streptomyces avermitilis]